MHSFNDLNSSVCVRERVWHTIVQNKLADLCIISPVASHLTSVSSGLVGGCMRNSNRQVVGDDVIKDVALSGGAVQVCIAPPAPEHCLCYTNNKHRSV